MNSFFFHDFFKPTLRDWWNNVVKQEKPGRDCALAYFPTKMGKFYQYNTLVENAILGEI
jgi:hypothetical protein